MAMRRRGWEKHVIGAKTVFGRKLSPVVSRLDLKPGQPVVLMHNIHGQFLGTVLHGSKMDVSHARTDTRDGDEVFVHRKELEGGGRGFFPSELKKYRPVDISELEKMGFEFMHKR
jgi:hypothetical protein